MIKCKLAEIRDKHNVSQKKLSETLDIRLATISKMENEELKTYSSDHFNKLCAYFNCSLSDLLEYIPDSEVFQPQEQNIQESVGERLTSDEAELLNNYRQLSASDKEKAQKLYEIFLMPKADKQDD